MERANLSDTNRGDLTSGSGGNGVRMTTSRSVDAGKTLYNKGVGVYRSGTSVAGRVDRNRNHRTTLNHHMGGQHHMYRTILIAVILACLATAAQGQSMFEEPALYGVQHRPWSAATGDIDGDGDIDVCIANAGDNTVSILSNDGSGLFPPATQIPAGPNPHGIVLVDLDADSDLDLAVTNIPYPSGPDAITILLNDGAGVFNFHGEYVANDDAVYLISDDINEDGLPDLVFASTQANTVTVMTNTGGAMFDTTSYATEAVGAHGVVCADFDGDDDLDIVSANFESRNLSLLLNDGTGAFTFDSHIPVQNKPTIPVAADFNADGHQDIAANHWDGTQVEILQNDGLAVFTSVDMITTGTEPEELVASDIDRNGHPDLVVPNFKSHTISVLLNDGSGQMSVEDGFVIPGSGARGPRSVRLADLNSDGSPDVITVNHGANHVCIVHSLCCFGSTGNIDGDNAGSVDLADVIYLVNSLFLGGEAPPCLAAANVNGDLNCDVDLSDVIYLVSSLFLGGDPPLECIADCL
ncbi:hypothetical protein GF420_12390 [candidate division GN15 bacterium]|nr:hypothetical protein [candidate division GN15 bacterium]